MSLSVATRCCATALRRKEKLFCASYGTTEEVAEKSRIFALHLYSRACSPTQKLQHGPDFQSGMFLKTLLPWYYTAGISLIIRTKL
jgi:hypothetical protein